MWEKCVGCGEGLFAGDAFCGNCGRPVSAAVPAAREPDGLESAPLAVACCRPGPGPHRPGRARPGGAHAAGRARASRARASRLRTGRLRTGRLGAAPPRQAQTAGDPASPRSATVPEDGVAADRPPQPHDSQRQPPARAAAAGPGPGPAVPLRPAATRLAGSTNLDPIRNARYLAYVLRQAGLFVGVYLLIETVLWLYLPLSRAAGTTHGSALRLEIDSVWLVALALAVLFWLIPVPALLTEWSLLMERGSDAAQRHSSRSMRRSGPMALRLTPSGYGPSPGTEKTIVSTWSCAAAISAATSPVSCMGPTCTSAGASGFICPHCACF